MALASASVVGWIANHVLPAEPAVRAWLRHAGRTEPDVEDLLQESYCRLAAMTSFTHVERPAAYLMQIVKNLHFESLRRRRVVQFEAFTEMLTSSIIDQEPDPESIVAARILLGKVEAIITSLPERCQKVLLLRRVDGLPQKDIAAQLGISETVVENELQKALRLLRVQLGEADCAPALKGRQVNFDGRTRKAG